MHVSTYDVFYSQNSHQNASTGIPVIFRLTLLYKNTNVVNRVTIIP